MKNIDQARARRVGRGVLLSALGVVLGLAAASAQAQSNTITRVSSFEYDAQGQLLREVIEPDQPDNCLQTTHTYNAQGNPTGTSTAACAGASGHALSSASVPRTNASAYGASSAITIDGVSYDAPAGMFATQVTSAAGQSESRELDPRTGAPLKLVGPNGGITTWAYDSFGRKVRENRADGTYTVLEYKLCQVPGQAVDALCASPVSYGGFTHTLEWYVKETSYGTDGVALAAASYQFHDTLGRAVRTRNDGFFHRDAAFRMATIQDTVYNALGQTVFKSIPYLIQGGNPWWSSYEYDAVGRVAKETTPDGNGASAVLQTSYNGLVVTITNALNQVKTIYKNALGQTDRIVDHLGVEVRYAYDALGQLTETNAAGSITRLTYDVRGRKTSMQDPAMGRWDYDYNVFGELVWQQDSLGKVTTMSYDVLGRMRERAEPDLVSNWYYDQRADGSSCGAGIGKLCEATANNGYRRLHTYDLMGRPTSTSNVLDNATQPAVVSQSYDAVTGRLKEQTWPSGYKAVYEYTTAGTDWTAGHLLRVRGMDNGTQNASWQALDKDPQGRLTAYLNGNNIVTQRDIEAVTGKVHGIQATLNGQAMGNVLNHAYTYDKAGNLLTRSDANTGVAESFGYDALNRLSMTTTLGGSLENSQSVQLLYDERGNIKYKSDVGYYHYDAQRPNRLTAITTTQENWSGAMGAVTVPNTGSKALAYAFDDYLPDVRNITLAEGDVAMGNGNLMYTVSQDQAGGAHTVRWEEYTSFNKIREMRFGNLSNPANPTDAVADRTVAFVYGPEHQRLRQTITLTSNAPSHMEAGTTWYMNGPDSLGLSYEKEVKANGLIEHKHYLSAGGAQFALHTQREGNLNGKPAKAVSYFHHDHLGSLAAITNEAGAVIERLAYDPWGKRRQVDGPSDPNGALTSTVTKRGYTMHEHMDEMGVINMNGRVYDPAIGRFLTADPYIQAPDNLQSFNRYAYVLNNPLAYTDPTGYWSLKKAWKKLKNVVLTVAAIYLDAMGCAGYCTMALNAYNAAKAKNPIAFVLAFTGLPSNPIAAAAVTAASGCVGAKMNGGNCGRGAGSALIQHAGGGGAATSLVAGCAASVNQGGSCRRGMEQAATSMATNYLAQAAIHAAKPKPSHISTGSYDDGAGLLNQDSPGMTKVCEAKHCSGSSYDEGSPFYHAYGPIENGLCNTAQRGCMDASRLVLGCQSAPGQAGCTNVGEQRNYSLPGITTDSNPITQYRVNPDVIINGTGAGHELHDGYVVRWLSVNGAGDVSVSTVGIGVNRSGSARMFNQYGGDLVFRGVGMQNSLTVKRILGGP